MSVERSKELFLAGNNCAQAIVGGFASEMGISEEEGLAISACFGAGICATRNLCGAICGGLMVIGMVKNKTLPDDKSYMYALGRSLMEKFNEKYGTTTCAELLLAKDCFFDKEPQKRDNEYYKKRPCLLFVEFVAEEITKMIAEN